jgi:coatomer subunit gamma
MMQSIERYMKRAVVDKPPSTFFAASASSIHLMRRSSKIVKRWVNKIQEAVDHENIMIQYDTHGLLYQIRRTDKHAVRKRIAKLSEVDLHSSDAYCAFS